MSTKQNITIIKLIALWQNLKPRREALKMTQPEFAAALDVSVSAYTHYESSAEKLTVDRLMQLDGKISMLEKAGGILVDNGGDKKQPHRIQQVLPKSLQSIPNLPTHHLVGKMLTGKA